MGSPAPPSSSDNSARAACDFSEYDNPHRTPLAAKSQGRAPLAFSPSSAASQSPTKPVVMPAGSPLASSFAKRENNDDSTSSSSEVQALGGRDKKREF